MTFPNYESFMQRLQRNRLEAEEKRRAAPKPLTLAERIDTWWQGLPAAEQRAAYSMEFFRDRFGESPARLGPALFSLGWERKRDWRIGKPHGRVWLKN
jgi:hypothetical protein